METNREKFKRVYKEELISAHSKYPEIYAWPISELEQVLTRIYLAIDKGSFNKDSHAFKATCKALGIKHTYQAIETFLGSQGAPQ